MMVLIGNDDKVNRPKFYGNSGTSGTFAFYCPHQLMARKKSL
ncbi:hypothetical protein ACG3JJ_10180 [Streptococcus parauberis]|uniref:Uncharacterized protein n=3 Tax=Streptococcus parauberis TaxID=1348 RepID=A0A2I8AIX9_9STRE|nr:hypothetical protein [Streptococcus parauberis]AUT05342.1 hypothetical protein SPSF3K_00609 [Streptococcus parauberis]EGE53267.1 hypothetical protein SPB_1619 [Streptococcus parauberis NCFD 2020]EMF49164.1 hypothetical protein SPJ2_1201 [Streptococcus parauberis KRS-02109]EMG24766.1 hypothetical protein SPJ1_1860 [Streptococcus parauberis KRS-02083]KYP30467.1 hypothetical protein ADO03_00409 [Streptococcus parauberis]